MIRVRAAAQAGAGAATRAGTLASLLLAGLLAAGCTIKVVDVTPEGRLDIVVPGGVFDVDGLASDWAVTGDDDAAAQRVRVVTLDGVPALRVDGGPDSFALVRRVRARLLVSPYLSWSWRMQASEPHPHPLRLVVGFHGGRPDSRSWGGQPLVWTGSRLPPHDRVLALVWGASSLQRGSFLAPDSGADGKPVAGLPRFVVRGGPEHADAWRLDTVDLSRLYHDAWPGDDVQAVTVMFVGFAYEARREDPAPPRGYLSGVVLSR